MSSVSVVSVTSTTSTGCTVNVSVSPSGLRMSWIPFIQSLDDVFVPIVPSSFDSMGGVNPRSGTWSLFVFSTGVCIASGADSCRAASFWSTRSIITGLSPSITRPRSSPWNISCAYFSARACSAGVVPIGASKADISALNFAFILSKEDESVFGWDDTSP